MDLSRKGLDGAAGFAETLEEAGLAYDLRFTGSDRLIIQVPGEHWEVEFYVDGDIQVEIYKSDGKILDASILPTLIANTI